MYFSRLYADRGSLGPADGYTVMMHIAGMAPTNITYTTTQIWFKDCMIHVDYAHARSFLTIYCDEPLDFEDVTQGSLIDLDPRTYNFLVSIGASFLPFCLDDRFVLEAYMPTRCPWQHEYDQVAPDCWDPTRARSMCERMFLKLSHALLGCVTGVIFRIPSRHHVPRFHFFFEKKHTEIFADLCSRSLDSLVGVTMVFSKSLVLVDTSHEQYPLTYVPDNFLGWDS